MKLKTKIIAFVLVLSMIFSFTACGDKNENAKVSKMQIGQMPTKTEYMTGDLFDPTGLILLVQYDNGNTAEITEGYTWDITDALDEDDDEITITFKKKSILLEIDIEVRVPTTLEVVSEEGSVKTNYEIGERFDKTGLKLLATYADGSTESVNSGFRVSPSGILSLDDTQIKITYNKAVCYLPITVNSPHITALSISTNPTKLVYNEGDFFDPTGMEVKAEYSDGSDAVIIDYNYSPKTALTTDVDKIEISYGLVKTTLDITVNEASKALFVTNNPTKTSYVAGENFDSTGMVVKLKENGSLRALASNEYTILNGENLSVGSEVTITLNSDNEVKTKVIILISEEINIVKDNISSTATYTPTHATLGKYAVNGDYVGNFVQDATILVNLNSETAGKANISIKAASAWVEEYSVINYFWPLKVGTVRVNALFDLYVNGVKVSIADDVVLKGSETSNENGDVSLLAQWTNVTLSNINLNAGENEIKLVFLAQIYKNADVTNNSGTFKAGIYSSPVIDTIKIAYGESSSHNIGATYYSNADSHWNICDDCGEKFNLANHVYDQEVASAKYLATPATCTEKATYYYSCVCGEKGAQSFEYGETLQHNYVTKAENGEHWSECTICGDTTAKSTEHNFVTTVTETASAQTVVVKCACGEETTQTINFTDANYVDLTAINLAGNNTEAWAISAGRTTAVLRDSGSTTVQKALEKSYNGGFITNLYGGSRIEVSLNVTAETTGSVVMKASSGYITSDTWSSNTAKTDTMQYNKIFKVYIRHSDNTTTDISIDDSVVLTGATGNYSIMANWQYVTFNNLTMKVGDTIVFESLASKNANGEYLYKDCGSNGTQSSATVDTVAVYTNK